MKKFLALVCTMLMVMSLFSGIAIAATANGGSATVKFDSGYYRAPVDSEVALKIAYTPGASAAAAKVKFSFSNGAIDATDLKITGAGVMPAGWTATIDTAANTIVYTGTTVVGNVVTFKPTVRTLANAGLIDPIYIADDYTGAGYSANDTVTMTAAAATNGLSAAYDVSLNLTEITVGKSASVSGIVTKGGKTPAATDNIYWLLAAPDAAPASTYTVVDKGQVVGGMFVTSTAVSFANEGSYRLVLGGAPFAEAIAAPFTYASETSSFGLASISSKYVFTLDNPGTVNFDEAKILTGKVEKWDAVNNKLIGAAVPVYSWYDVDGTKTRGAQLVTAGSDGSFAAIVKYSDIADYFIGAYKFSYATVVSLAQKEAIVTKLPETISYVPGANNPIDIKVTLGKNDDGTDKVSLTGTTQLTLSGVKIKDQAIAGWTIDRTNSTWVTGATPYFTKLVMTKTGTPEETITGLQVMEQGTLTIKVEHQPNAFVGKYDYSTTKTIQVGGAAKFNANLSFAGPTDADNNLLPNNAYTFTSTAFDNNNLAADGAGANPLNKIVVKVTGPGYEETKFENAGAAVVTTPITFKGAGTVTITTQGYYDNGNLTDILTKTYTLSGFNVALESTEGYVDATNPTTIKVTVTDANGNAVNNAKVELVAKNGANAFILKNSNDAYPDANKASTVSINGLAKTIVNGVYEIPVKLLAAADVSVNVYKFNSTLMTWPVTPTSTADYTIIGTQVYTVTLVQPTILAGVKETMAIKVTDANGNAVTSGVTFKAKPATTVNGEAISDLGTLGYSIEDNTFKIPNVVANLVGEYSITASTDNGNKAGKAVATAVKVGLQLNYTDTTVTENFKDHFTVNVVDPRTNEPMKAKLYVGSTMPYINDAKATGATATAALYPKDDNGKYATQEVTGYLGATTQATSYDFKVLTTDLNTKNTSTDTELAPQIRIRHSGVNPDGTERLNTIVTLDVKPASFKVTPEAIFANTLNNVDMTYVDSHGNPLVEYKVNVPGVLTDTETDANGKVAFAILPNATSVVKITGETDNGAVKYEQNLNFTLDTVKPVLAVNVPATVKTNTLVVTGTVTDNVKVDKVYVNNSQVFVFDGAFETEVALKVGANNVKVYAFDASGNGVQEVVTVNYVLPTVVKLAVGSADATIGGAPATTVAPYLKNNSTMVPFRFIGEALGATVDYNAATASVTYSLEGNTIVLTIGSTTAMVNGEAKTLTVAPEIVNDRTMVPVRFVSENLGAVVDWNAAGGITVTR